MLDIGWSELLVIGIVALVVIGPKELPGVLRSVGKTVTKLRRMAGEFQGQFQEALREAELDGLKKDFTDFGDTARNSLSGALPTNPLLDLESDVKSAISVFETPPATPLPASFPPPPEPVPVSPAAIEQEVKAVALVPVAKPDPAAPALLEPEAAAKPKPRRTAKAALPDAVPDPNAPEPDLKPKPKRKSRAKPAVPEQDA
ncbi:MAG TPA: Sec-independent protein translocase protein TatB [Xanthobacteraceae bacterium]|nr:Sec-independent protein translocase protein TatB [Xanthobacteraceae bacterium]